MLNVCKDGLKIQASNFWYVQKGQKQRSTLPSFGAKARAVRMKRMGREENC
jgi:hypothetical protein